MFRIKINRDFCKSCGLCIEYCARKLLVIDPVLNRRGVTPVKFDKAAGKDCSGCGNCAAMCPDAAIEIEEVGTVPVTAGCPKKPAQE